ncbi:hypothetical protein SLE2022_304860 [Rubroshorea leprosula]
MENRGETNGEVKNKNEKEGKEKEAPPLMALNHVSRLCRNLKDCIDFYTKILGFVPIKRPQTLDFKGAWLFNYGVGIHLRQSEDEERLPLEIKPLDPKDNHISFQSEDVKAMEQRLKDFNWKYMKRTIEDENGTPIEQLFFNDPDGFTVEICNCENLKPVPAGSFGRLKLPFDRHNPPVELDKDDGGDDA